MNSAASGLATKYCLEKLYGGKVILSVGNFKQDLPVIRSDKQELTQQSHISKKHNQNMKFHIIHNMTLVLRPTVLVLVIVQNYET